MDMEIVILSEVSQMEKDKYYMLSLMCLCVHAKLLQLCLFVTLCTTVFPIMYYISFSYGAMLTALSQDLNTSALDYSFTHSAYITIT